MINYKLQINCIIFQKIIIITISNYFSKYLVINYFNVGLLKCALGCSGILCAPVLVPLVVRRPLVLTCLRACMLTYFCPCVLTRLRAWCVRLLTHLCAWCARMITCWWACVLGISFHFLLNRLHFLRIIK